MLIARLIADSRKLESALDTASAALAEHGWPVVEAGMLKFCGEVLQILWNGGDPSTVRAILADAFGPCDLIVSDKPFETPRLMVSDMDSTMIQAECIDELADFAGIKDQIAAITESAMRGELDFAEALTERVGLLAGLEESAIQRCLDERIAPMAGARTLVETLKAKGCRTVLVTGGFHSFADPVARQLGFERVVANTLGTQGGKLTGKLATAIVDSSSKLATLEEEIVRLGDGALGMAIGDGANDIPMIAAADFGIAYYAKPKARNAADGWIERGDLTSILQLFDIPREEWVEG